MRAFANGSHPFDMILPSAQKQVVAGLLGCAVGPKRDQYLSEVCTCTCTCMLIHCNYMCVYCVYVHALFCPGYLVWCWILQCTCI